MRRRKFGRKLLSVAALGFIQGGRVSDGCFNLLISFCTDEHRENYKLEIQNKEERVNLQFHRCDKIQKINELHGLMYSLSVFQCF